MTRFVTRRPVHVLLPTMVQNTSVSRISSGEMVLPCAKDGEKR